MCNNDSVKVFIFGVDYSPQWFLDKVMSKDVEYIITRGKVTGCRFYDLDGHEITRSIGDVIDRGMLYPKTI